MRAERAFSDKKMSEGGEFEADDHGVVKIKGGWVGSSEYRRSLWVVRAVTGNARDQKNVEGSQ